MKNIVKILSIILLLTFVIGCSKVTDTDLLDTVDDTDTNEKPVATTETTTPQTEVTETTQPVEKTQTETTETTKTETKENAEEETTETTKTTETQQTSTELQVLLNKIDTKVRNFKYTFGEPPFNTEINEYKVQLKNAQGQENQIIRVDLYEYDENPLIKDRWDTVFLNPAQKTAKIYCLSRSYCQTKEKDKTNETKNVDYDKYKTMTPYDWAKVIPKNAKLISKELMNGRSVTRFEYVGQDGLKYNIWIDNTYGLPMQVEREDSAGAKIKYIYRELSLNSVNAEDFELPF